jgi:hypothetical protein
MSEMGSLVEHVSQDIYRCLCLLKELKRNVTAGTVVAILPMRPPPRAASAHSGEMAPAENTEPVTIAARAMLNPAGID